MFRDFDVPPLEFKFTIDQSSGHYHKYGDSHSEYGQGIGRSSTMFHTTCLKPRKVEEGRRAAVHC